MASTLDDAMTYQMLRRLPPQTFVIQWRKYRPNQPIPQAGINIAQNRTESDITIQGTLNEVALMNHARVAITLKGNTPLNLSANPINIETSFRSPYNKAYPFNGPQWKYGMANIITGSRENFNAGSLYLLENTDEVSSAPINVFRGLCARRTAHFQNNDFYGNTDDLTLNQLTIEDLEMAGFTSNRGRTGGLGVYSADPANVLQIGAQPVTAASDQAKTFMVPLGFFSSAANSYPVLPLGLFSNFAVNGYGVNLVLNNGSNSIISVNYRPYGTGGGGAETAAGTALAEPTPIINLYNIELHIPIIQILNQDIVNNLLALYRKQATVNVGGVSVPMSLRLNTINYDFKSFPLQAISGLQHFVIPTTEKSIRALGWIVYDTSGKDLKSQENNVAGNRTPENNSPAKYPLCVTGINLKEFRLRAGRDDLIPAISNTSPNSGEVESFVYSNLRKAAAVFSPFPYWEEVTKKSGGAEELLVDLMSKTKYGVLPPNTNIFDSNQNYFTRNNSLVQYGCVSFQNTTFNSSDMGQVAAGISMNNIGRFDVEMDFRSIDDSGNGNLVYADPFIPNANSMRIAFIIAYDEVVELSANSGVNLITNAVMV